MITAPVNYPVPYRLLPLFLHSSPINTALRDFPWENNRLDGATRPKPRAARRGGVRGEQV